MTPSWERTPAPPTLAGPLLMNAVLRPHRSLSGSAFWRMLAIVVIANAAMATLFIAQGALPVAGFLGLDVLALWLAFRSNYRAARVEECVQVAAGQVHVASTGVDGATVHWTLNPVWARVLREGRGVVLRAGGAQLRLGAFLSPAECASFADALDLALYKAKRGYSPSTSRIE